MAYDKMKDIRSGQVSWQDLLPPDPNRFTTMEFRPPSEQNWANWEARTGMKRNQFADWYGSNQGGNATGGGGAAYQPVGSGGGGFAQTPVGQAGPSINQGGGSTPGYAAGPGAPAGGNLLGGYQPVGDAGTNGLVRRRVSEGTTHRVGRYGGGGPSGTLPTFATPYLPSTNPLNPPTGTTPETKTPLDPGMRIGQMTRGLWQKLGQRIGYQPVGYGGGGVAQTPAGQPGPTINQGGNAPNTWLREQAYGYGQTPARDWLRRMNAYHYDPTTGTMMGGL
ncbi:MAG: hypothetical protein V1755_06700 [Chloroflexota bacterium]